MWMTIAILVVMLIVIYYDHIQVKKIFAETLTRINKIYDNVKSFLVIHFLDTTISDSDTEENID